MGKIILLITLIFSLPSGVVVARFLYKRGNLWLEGSRLALEEKRLAFNQKQADYTDRFLQ